MKKTLITCLMMGLSLWLSAQDTILPYPIDTVNGTAVYRYTPEKSIGLYRISVTFGVPMGEIVQWNPQLEKRGPQLTDVLLIPVKQTIRPATKDTHPAAAPVVAEASSVQEAAQTAAPEAKAEPAVQEATPFPFSTPVIQELSGTVIKIAVILPLNAKALTRDANDDRFYDFYAGVLLAIRQEEKKGQKFEIHTYDVDRSDTKLAQLQNDSFIRQAHAIIGPVYTPQIEQIAKIVNPERCLILSPFSSSIPSLSTHSNILQFNPTSAMEATVMANYIAAHSDSLQCLMLNDGEEEMSHSIRELYRNLVNRQIPITRVPLHAILNDSLSTYMQEDKGNLFIFHKDKFSNLNVLMPYLTRAEKTGRLTLYSTYSWEKENIAMSHIYTSVFCPTSDSVSAAKTYYQKCFDHYFGHTITSTHPRYDILGYDLTCHLILIVQQCMDIIDITDQNYKDHILSQPYHGIITDIQYQRMGEGGYINNSITVLNP